MLKHKLTMLAIRLPQPFRAWILYGLVAPDLRQFEPHWKWYRSKDDWNAS